MKCKMANGGLLSPSSAIGYFYSVVFNLMIKMIYIIFALYDHLLFIGRLYELKSPGRKVSRDYSWLKGNFMECSLE